MQIDATGLPSVTIQSYYCKERRSLVLSSAQRLFLSVTVA